MTYCEINGHRFIVLVCFKDRFVDGRFFYLSRSDSAKKAIFIAFMTIIFYYNTFSVVNFVVILKTCLPNYFVYWVLKLFFMLDKMVLISIVLVKI